MAEETFLPNQDQPDLTTDISPIDTAAIYDPLAALKIQSPKLPVIPDPIPPPAIANAQVVGNYRTGPNPGAHPDTIKKTNNTSNYVKGVMEKMKGTSYAVDPFKYAKPYSFGNDAKGGLFDRYYNHNLFSKIGYSPYRDNESWYNEQGSWWDDHMRMWGEFVPLLYSAFKSVYGSEKDADEAMDKGMNIAMSTRPGVGSWINNFVLQSAYTIGILAEVAVEDFAVASLEAFSLGNATPLIPAQFARNSMVFGRLAKGISRTSELLKELRTVDKAKDMWSLSRAADVGVATLEFLNPLRHTTDWAFALKNGERGVRNMSELAKATKTFGNFYRDARELNLAYSEAAFEGEAASRELQDDLIDEYYATHGMMPENETVKDIYKKAQETKAAVTMANSATIYYTNRLVFDNIFGMWKPASKVAKAMEQSGGRYLRRTAAKEWNIGKAAYQAEAKSFGKKTFDALTKSSYLPWSKRYFLGNLAEGIQESSQEVIASAAKDYYRKLYEDPSQVGYYKAVESIGRGLDSQFSAEGLNTFLSGYLMGSLIQGGGSLLQKGRNVITEAVTGRDKVLEEKKREENQNNSILNAANHVINNFKIYGDHTNTMASAVKIAFDARDNAINNGDTKTAFDMSDQGNAEYFHHVVKTGNTKLVTDWANDMLQLSDEDLTNASNVNLSDAANVRKNLETLKKRITRYEARFNEVTNKFPNPFNPWLYNAKKNPEAFAREYDNYTAHENTVADLLFSLEDHVRMSERMQSIARNLAGQSGQIQNLINVTKNGTPVANAAAHDVSLLIDGIARAETVAMLSKQVEIMKKGTPEQQKEAKQIEKRLTMLRQWDSNRDFYVRELKMSKKILTDKEKYEREQLKKIKPGAIANHDKTAERFEILEIKGDKVVVKNQQGKKKIVSNKSITVIKESKQKPGEFEAELGDDVSLAISELYKTYKEYLSDVAQMKEGYIFDEQLNEAFRQIKDFLTLQVDSFDTVRAINFLSNPEYFDNYRVMQSNLMSQIKTQRLFFLENALEKYNTMRKNNKMLNEIFDLGLFVLPDDIDNIKNFQVPANFYNVTTKEIVPADSDLHKQAVEIVNKYAELAGVKATQAKPTEAEEAAPKAPEAQAGPKTGVSVQPPEKPEELADDEPIKITTSIATMKEISGTLVEDLVNAYRELKEEEGETITGTVDEIASSDDFVDFVQAGGTAFDIISQFNEETGRTREPEIISTREQVVKEDDYSVGNTFNFTGRATTKDGAVDISNKAVEVVNKSGVYKNPKTGKQEQLVTLEDVETGDKYTINILGPDAKNYRLDEYVEPDTPKAKLRMAEKYLDLVNAGIDNLEDVIDSFEAIDSDTEEEVSLDDKKTSVFDEFKKIVNEYGTDPDSVQRYIDETEDDLMTLLYEEHNDDFMQIVSDYGEGARYKREAEQQEVEEEDTTDAYTKLMQEYSEITDQDELEEWKDKAILLKNTGKIPSTIKIMTLVNAKMSELANSVTIDLLVPGTIVKTYDGNIMYVIRNKDNIVSLVTPLEWAARDFSNSVDITKDELDMKISNIINDFSDEVEEGPEVTSKDQEDMKDGEEEALSDDIKDIAATVAAVKDDIEAEGKSLDAFFDDMLNDINNCNLG